MVSVAVIPQLFTRLPVHTNKHTSRDTQIKVKLYHVVNRKTHYTSRVLTRGNNRHSSVDVYIMIAKKIHFWKRFLWFPVDTDKRIDSFYTTRTTLWTTHLKRCNELNECQGKRLWWFTKICVVISHPWVHFMTFYKELQAGKNKW